MRIADLLSQSERALWVCAHPDDENSAGGLVARARDLAGTLYMASLTRGENSDILWGGLGRGREIGASREELFAGSADIFGAADFSIGPFVNGPHALDELESFPEEPHRGWSRDSTPGDVLDKWSNEGDPLDEIVRLLKRWRPDVVIAMDEWCGVSGNPEHIAVGQLLLRATASSEGAAWCPRAIITTAWVIPQLEQIGFRKCQGEEPSETIEELATLEQSTTHGRTYFSVARRVAVHYANAMRELGLPDEEIDRRCTDMEREALDAVSQGKPDRSTHEPYRVRRVPVAIG